jgi:hypothetical protein
MTRKTRVVALVVFLLSVLAAYVASQTEGISARASAQAGTVDTTPVVLSAGRRDASSPLRAMPIIPSQSIMGQAPAPGPLPGRNRPDPETRQPDAAVQALPGPAAPPAPVLNFNGLDNVDALLPPDTNGDIGYDPATGKKYYVQMVNVSFAVWDVTGSPNPVYGPGRNNTLWQGFWRSVRDDQQRRPDRPV